MTKETKHTPGPWKVDSFDTRKVVTVGHEFADPQIIAQDLNEGDAKLIASAPDLLAQRDELREACEIALADFIQLYDGPQSKLDNSAGIKAIRKALSRCAAPEAPKGWKEVDV